MRKIIILGLLAATVVPSVASAQSYGEARRSEQRLREDWQDYRRSHRDVYRAGNWNAPFRYSRWNAGAQLRPAYYSSRYYIADPYRYRLPRPAANQRWVRHYNDVMLVNVRTGRVMTVHRGFFW
ncbi:RcnB family protein [Sphingobium sp.]|uniref:RcnB family protein n=1 Tax=Sphingobium sp. TaxID=1912891 RepID=UPI00257EB62D|nr:RcnB family protein [Sphingobium sp.]MBR2268976.1 RcnB family protein [Sphingobium sp.]